MANKKKEISNAFNNLSKPKIDNENPAMNIISEQPPAGLDLLPGYGIARTETKSKRVQLMFPPTLWQISKDRATAAGLSFNEYVLQLCEKELKRKD